MIWRTEKQEEQDIETAQNLIDFEEELNDPGSGFWYLRFFLGLNLIVWFVVLLIPNLIVDLFSILGTGKISTLLMMIPFGLGLYTALITSRMKFQDESDNTALDSDLMGSMKYQSSSNTRYLIWIGSILLGLLNVALLGLVSYTLYYNDLYLFSF